jgi:signal transduction histidine kinase
MKTPLAVVIALVIAASANSAPAYVVEVAASIPVPNGEDSAQLDDALRSVVDDILKNAIGFTPTVVTLQSARRVGDRIYMLFVIADKDGEEMIEALSSETSAPTDTERAPSPSPGPTTGLPEVRPPSTANPM